MTHPTPEDKAIELEPCPFCGEPGVMRKMYQEYFPGCSAKCVTIPVAVAGQDGFRNLADAITFWNTRPETSALRSRIEALEGEFRQAGNELAALIPHPNNPKVADWPCENEADQACLDNAYDIICRTIEAGLYRASLNQEQESDNG